jgi:hypothetical protein
MFTEEKATAGRDLREMDRVEAAADRMEAMCDRLAGFLGRFHGSPQQHAEGANPRAVPSGYRGQLDRLYDHINLMENQISDLISLG